jgi:hypothetical protein
MDLTFCLASMAILGLAVLGLMIAFVHACDKV